MAATTNTTNSSPPSPVVTANDNATLSPRSTSLTRTASPPWTQIVRGLDSKSTQSAISAPLECSSDNNNNSNNDNSSQDNSENVVGGGKVAWNKKPTNGPVENGGPGPVVMGQSEAWPALSESTSKASPKLDSSSKNLPEFGSLSSSQVIGTESSSPSLSITSSLQSQSQSPSSSPKPTTNNSNHNPMPNHGRTTRQRSMRRDGGTNPQANGGFAHHFTSSLEGPHNNSNNNNNNNNSSSRDNNQNHGHREPGSRNTIGDHHHQSRNSFRRGGGGSHSREGSHQNFGGRRGDQDRGNHDWNHQRSFNGREATMQPRVSPRGFRPPPVSTPIVYTTPMRPAFVSPMGVPEVPMFYLPAVPFVAPVPEPVFIHTAQDPQLNAKIINQIDYYFSNENLVKDTYLRQNMDENGWVPVTLIANFKKVMQLTQNIQQILDALRSSNVVEVQGDKIRKRDDWANWIMPPSIQFPIASGSQSSNKPNIDGSLAARFQNVRLVENKVDQNHTDGC